MRQKQTEKEKTDVFKYSDEFCCNSGCLPSIDEGFSKLELNNTFMAIKLTD